MHPEFKAYVEAITKAANQVRPARPARQSDRAAQPVAATTKSFFTFIADLLDELPPYYCELKMVPGVKCRSNCLSLRRDAIGYHGLI